MVDMDDMAAFYRGLVVGLAVDTADMGEAQGDKGASESSG
jgi:hypothetical protein